MIAPEYYNKGDALFKTTELCKKSGVILKDLNLRLYGKVEEMHERFENSEPSYSIAKYKSYDNIGYDSNDWLADAAGSDDPEEMSVAFWNMD